MGLKEGSYWIELLEIYINYTPFDCVDYTSIKDCDQDSYHLHTADTSNEVQVWAQNPQANFTESNTVNLFSLNAQSKSRFGTFQINSAIRAGGAVKWKSIAAAIYSDGEVGTLNVCSPLLATKKRSPAVSAMQRRPILG